MIFYNIDKQYRVNFYLLSLICKSAILLPTHGSCMLMHRKDCKLIKLWCTERCFSDLLFFGEKRGSQKCILFCFKQPSDPLNWTLLVFSNGPFQYPQQEKTWLPQPIMRIQDPKKIWSRNRSLLNLLCKSAILLTFWGLERGYPMTCFKQPSVQLTWTLLVFSNGPQLHFQCPLPLPPASRACSMLLSSFYLVLFETMGCVCVFRFYFWFLTLEKIWLPQPIMRIQDPKKKLIEKSCPIKSIM